MKPGTLVSGRSLLDTGWQLIALRPGACSSPQDLPPEGWTETRVPSTAASSLRAAGSWSLDDPPRRFDAQDWWYRLQFAAGESAIALLELEGLATIADVWLNGTHLLHSENMFLGHVLRVQVRAQNDLVIRFAALDAELQRKRPRPRWRAPMIEHQQLRWIRTTVLGRTPGWSPPAAAVGPWRPISLLIDTVRAPSVHVRSWLDGSTGHVEVSCASDASSLTLTISGHRVRHEAKFRTDSNGWQVASLRVQDPALWWPHTHGTPERYALSLSFSDASDGTHTVDLHAIGFRHIKLDTRDDSFVVRVNGVAVFCRGACWTPLDIVSLSASEADYATAVQQAVDAGMNMLRVSGTTIYEADAFYETCDRLGVLVWQDFMFANMDFPAEDATFVDSVRAEAKQFLHRVAGRPSLAVLCGNSEVEQQAAMWGAPRERWQPALFHELLREVVDEYAGNVLWWPSSAHGGVFPHQPRSGTTSYYGLGAYLRSLEDVRSSGLRFATECLAFANVPEVRTLQAMPGGLMVKSHHPIWKQRSPRDLGAGWDFDDVRDFYLTQLFKLDPMQLRYSDHDRYLQLSRVVSGELMQYAFLQWRRMDSSCGGALVWFLRDLWPGAGWGIVGSDGAPKAALYFLRRALRPINVHVSDEGQSGLLVHLVNESARDFSGNLTLCRYSTDGTCLSRYSMKIEIPARNHAKYAWDALLEGFSDLTWSYRFGPPAYEVAHAQLHTSEPDATQAVADGWYFPVPELTAVPADIGLQGDILSDASGLHLIVRTHRFARAVTVDLPGYEAEDQYFNLAPSGERRLRLRATSAANVHATGTLRAINALRDVPIGRPS